MRYSNCSECPCLNNDYEYGGSCNLGYDTSLEWYRKSDNTVVDRKIASCGAYDLAYVSVNCGLLSIITKDGEKPLSFLNGKEE